MVVLNDQQSVSVQQVMQVANRAVTLKVIGAAHGDDLFAVKHRRQLKAVGRRQFIQVIEQTQVVFADIQVTITVLR